MEILAFDTETHLMGPCNVYPQIVCCSMAFHGGVNGDEVVGELAATSGPLQLDQMVSQLFNGDTDGFIKVVHNASFDLGVCFRYKPELISGIFKEIEEGRVHCTIIREKLLHLCSHGDVRFVKRGNFKQKIDYHLSGLVQQYLNIDITADKDDSDAWRKNYKVLEDIPVADWPEDAREYAINDSKYLLPIWQAQEDRRQLLITDRGIDPFATLTFRVGMDFCLNLMSAWGISIDPIRKTIIEAELAESLKPENLNLLMEAGILRPGVEPQPYKKGTKNPDGTLKMKKGKAESIDLKKLKDYVKNFAENTEDVTLKMTKPSKSHPEGQISTDADFMDEYWHLDPVLEQFRNRAKLQQMVKVEIPRMNWEGKTSPIVHPCYDVLKETGRTSSFATKIYPSFNCQNVQPRARSCFVARPGHLLLSTDYSQMELGTTAQKCFELFGYSVMRDKINAGQDLHAYLGSQLALSLEPAFAENCAAQGADDADKIFAAFEKCKDDDNKAVRAFYKKYRTFAKPTGLGFPGGLGPATFIQYAKATFGVIVTKEMATELRTIWRQTFPEVTDFHKWINDSCVDPYNTEQTEKGERKLYAYSTPMGLYRAGCTYCAAANGVSLQSPSAEGALTAVYNIVKAVYDPSMNNVLYGVYRPIMFIHDELVGEVPDGDQEVINACVQEVDRIMIAAMRIITPDVEPRTEAVLMRRWDKFAEPTFDSKANLICTEEKGDGHATQTEAETQAQTQAEVETAEVAEESIQL